MNVPSPDSPESIPNGAGDPLPVRMLNEFVYCPRLFYYEHVESVFQHNADTKRGAALHARVDRGKGELPPAAPVESRISNLKSEIPPAAPEVPEVIHSRSVSLSSDRLGVTAKMDLVEVRATAGAAADATAGDLLAPLTVCPVDYKIGAPREGDRGPELWDADKIQLGLQCLILRDHGYTCTEGIIYYRATKQRVPLLITPELERWIEAQIAAARRTMTGPIPPPLVDSPKCARCSLVTICLPDETRLMREAPAHPDEEEATGGQEAFPFDREFGSPAPPAAAGSDLKSQISNLKSHPPVRRLVAARDDRKPLYISTTAVSIGRKSELIQIREKGEVISEVRITDLSHVAVFGPATISTALLQTLCDRDIPVSYFSSGGMFYGLTRGHSLKNVFTRLAQFHYAAKSEEALRHARTFVHGKIRNQRTMLMRNHALPPVTATERLKYAAQSALEAASLGELLGLEGSAALAYFENFSGMIKLGENNADEALLESAGAPGRTDAPLAATPARSRRDAPGQQFFRFDFTRRNRRPPRDAVNALLSFGYALLARDCTIAAHAVGFDPYVGFYHQPRFGRPALALDLMEEFRPLIADSVALTLINNRVITPADFVRAGDAVNLSADGRKRFFGAYEQRLNTTIVHPVFDYQVSYRRAIELQARLLAKTLTGETEQYVPFMTR